MKKMKKLAIILAMSIAAVACNNQTETHDTAHEDDGSTHMMEDHTSAEVGMDPDFTIDDPNEKEAVRKLYQQYLVLKDGLVAGDNQKTDKAADEMMSSISEQVFTQMEGGAHDTVAELGRDIVRINEHSDIDQQRNYLNSLSLSLFNLLQAADIEAEPVYLQYCPMAFDDQGAYWLSNVSEIRNPYFGDKMLKCGSVKKSL